MLIYLNTDLQNKQKENDFYEYTVIALSVNNTSPSQQGTKEELDWPGRQVTCLTQHLQATRLSLRV